MRYFLISFFDYIKYAKFYKYLFLIHYIMDYKFIFIYKKKEKENDYKS
ncbi:hypothetical protein AlmWB_00990 [Candidatus Phytoplasma phoenicium]|uniref:Uncharacterized protein n=1 Tax=Candidatus Phytoplasma phoenicium TaxID=198422 RepID=A0A0L0MK95_9MOLU|nr:hypothetical protein AlmWB_00990 [Candidatus Phytoplasma phoenicium]